MACPVEYAQVLIRAGGTAISDHLAGLEAALITQALYDTLLSNILVARRQSTGLEVRYRLMVVHVGGIRPSTVGPFSNHGSGAMAGLPGSPIHAPHQLKVEFAMTFAAA